MARTAAEKAAKAPRVSRRTLSHLQQFFRVRGITGEIEGNLRGI